MSLFAAMEHIEYESDKLLGVYSTQDRAKDACVRYHKDCFADFPEIRERVWNWVETKNGLEGQPAHAYYTVQPVEVDEDL